MSVLLYAGSDTCYSVQLQSSYTPLHVEKFPLDATVMKIGDIYTVREGCFERLEDAKQALYRVKARYSDAIITSTYRWRLKKSVAVPVREKKRASLSLQLVKQKSSMREPKKKDTPKCYSIALSFSKKKLVAQSFPPGTTLLKRGDFFTASYGCYSKIDDAKKALAKMHKRRPHAIIILLAKSYFHQNRLLPEIKKRAVPSDNREYITPQKQEGEVHFYRKEPNIFSEKKELSKRCTTAIERKIIPCRDEVISSKKAFLWESVNRDAIFKYVDAKLHNEAATQEMPLYETPIPLEDAGSEINETTPFYISDDLLHWYITATLNIKNGQLAPTNQRLKTRVLHLSFGLTYLYNFTPFWYFYTDDRVVYSIQRRSTNLKFDVKEFYLKSNNLFDNRANIVLGRKYLKDARGWYYKTSLDTIGIANKHDLLLYELYGGERLTKNSTSYDPNDVTTNLKGTKFLFAHGSYEYFKENSIEGFFIYEENKKRTKKLNWRGFRLKGSIAQKNLNRVSYWGDIATMQGDINQSSRRGLGFDIGAKYYFTDYFSALAGSFAYGSGGGSLFMQPSFTNNRSNYLSQDVSFRYYGEFLQPKLSNLSIGSLYLLHHFKRIQDKTLIVALHNYRQDKRSTRYYSATNKTVAPGGKKRDIGNEIDVILHYDLIPGTYWRLSGGYFMGGDAFEGQTEKKDGWSAEIYFKYLW